MKSSIYHFFLPETFPPWSFTYKGDSKVSNKHTFTVSFFIFFWKIGFFGQKTEILEGILVAWNFQFLNENLIKSSILFTGLSLSKVVGAKYPVQLSL